MNITNYPTKQIKVKEVFIPEFQMREVKKDSQKYQMLRNSIQKDGQLQPIGVKVYKGNKGEKYSLVFGFHRITVFQELNLDTIDAKIFPEDLQEHDLQAVRMIENLIRTDASPKELARQLERIFQAAPNISIEEHLARLGIEKSAQWARGMLRLNKLCPEAAELVDNKRIGLKNAQLLGELPKAIQTEHLEAAQNLNSTEFNERIQAEKEILKQKDSGKPPAPPSPWKGSSIRNKPDIISELEKLVSGINVLNIKPEKDTDPLAFAIHYATEVLKWVIAMDPASVQLREDKAKLSAEQRQKNKETVSDAEKLLREIANKDPQKAAELKAAIEKAKAEVVV